MHDQDLPLLVIVDALLQRGWSVGDAPENHTMETPKLFGDGATVTMKRRFYLHCCLLLPELTQRGLQNLPSGECEPYYKVLLRSKRPAEVPRGMDPGFHEAAAEEERSLSLPSPSEAGSSDKEDLAEQPLRKRARRGTLAPQVAPAPLRPAPATPLVAAPGAPATPDLAALPDTLTLPVPVAPPAPDVSAGAASSATASVAAAPPVREHLGPAEAVFQTHGEQGTKGAYKRWFVACPFHTDCSRSRTVSAQHTHLGEREPLGYLAVWLDRGSALVNREQHMKLRIRPNDPAIEAYMRARGWRAMAE